MPILYATIGVKKTSSLSKRISDMLIQQTQEKLGKDPKLMAIIIQYVDPEDWLIGGKSLNEQGLASFALEIKITDETNTKDEKAAYMKAVFSEFRKILGELHEESYIHVHDVRAAAYGFGGLSQEQRYIEKKNRTSK